MKLERLDHFGIDVRDLKRAERFYVDVLGLDLVARFGDQVLLRCGEQNLALFRTDAREMTTSERAERIAQPLGKSHHAFRVNRADFEAAPERLARAGVECGTTIDWGDHDCRYFLDPDGNLLEMVNYC
jgi:catechol 2,3-dioxygenase-like lactoylglutathione lyase family enzyme